MPLYYIDDEAIASLSGGPDFGTIRYINPLAPGAAIPAAQSQRLILWSGWCGDTIFARDFRTWTPAAWERLDRFLLPLPEGGGRGVGSPPRDNHPDFRICFRPHPRHLLADPQSCLSFLKRHESIELLLDPAGFLTRSMLPRAEEHLLRALDSLSDHPQVSAIIISNVAPASDDDDLLEPVPLDQGLLPVVLIRLIHSRATDKPRVLIGKDSASQARFLNAPG